MSRHKSMSRLRAILESVTLAAVATTGAVAAAPSLASAASLVSDRGCTAVGCPDAAAGLDDLAHRLAACLTELPPLAAAGASAELATSPDVDDRAALAEALAWIFPLATDDVLIDHLAGSELGDDLCGDEQTQAISAACDHLAEWPADQFDEIDREPLLDKA